MKLRLFLIFVLCASALSGLCTSPRLFTRHEEKLLDTYNSAERTIGHDGDYSKALDLYLEFIREAEGNEALAPQLARAYISVAVIYGSFKDLDNAIAYNNLAYPLARRLNDTRMAELALVNLAMCSLRKNDFASVERATDSLQVLARGKSRTVMFHYYIIKGETAQRNGRNDEALDNFRKARNEAVENRLSPYEQSAPLTLIAEHFEITGKPDSQLVYLNKAWKIIDTIADPEPRVEVARNLMILHTRRGNLNEARKFQDIYLALSDSLFNHEQFLSVSTRHEHRRMVAKGMEIESLNRTALRHKLIIAVIAFLLIVSLVSIILIIRQKHSLKVAYQSLFEKDKRLMALTDKPEEREGDSSDAQTDGEPADTERNRELYDRIVKMMDSTADYLNVDFGLSNIVTGVGSNAAYVSRVIKRYSGLNVPSFINEYRIREACRRLLDDENYGNLTFGAIGESVGFSTQVSFNRTFKKVTGITPSLYRKMAEAERR